MSEELAFASASSIASRVRSGDLSPVEVVEYFLDRIEEIDPEINAFTEVCAERAQEAAERRERAVERGEDLGPLWGVPVAIKDLVEVKGTRTTYGSKLFADFVSEEDALVVERLTDAGAIVIGKTNTPEFGRKPMTTNYLHGTTCNPWDSNRTVGGSSGGSAAALAAGMVPLSQASDAAGSIRIPSAACGVFGLMPDFGRVPQGKSRPDAFLQIHPYTYLGPMARTVEDAALMLDVMAGPADSDPFSLRSPAGSYTEAVEGGLDVGELSIAYSPDLGICQVEDRISEVIKDAIDDLEAAGASVERVDPNFAHDWEGLHDALEVLLQDRYLGMHDNFKRDQDLDLLEHSEDVTDEVISRIEKALDLEPIDVRRAERVRTEAYDTVQTVLADHDLLATPTLGMVPFEKETKPTEIEGEAIDPLHGWALTWPINLTGNPTASIPVGFADGLPVGMQLVGPRPGDKRVLAASAEIERIRPWADAYPPRE
jgi:Asp-tRNA(Asn)/Glu-tRNA(Gln) amidotransferase A subunit family amidase